MSGDGQEVRMSLSHGCELICIGHNECVRPVWNQEQLYITAQLKHQHHVVLITQQV